MRIAKKSINKMPSPWNREIFIGNHDITIPMRAFTVKTLAIARIFEFDLDFWTPARLHSVKTRFKPCSFGNACIRKENSNIFQ